MKILIIGGSGGIGFAVLRRCLHTYPDAQIIATYNNQSPRFEHTQLEWLKLDVVEEQQIEQLSNQLGPIDILVNAVGFLHSSDKKPEKTIDDFDPAFFQQNIRLNTLPSILLAKHFMQTLNADNKTFFIVLSAKIGSISDNRSGGWLSYRASKSALNMAVKTISIEWKRKLPNCSVLLFHPGTTDTNLSKPFQRGLPSGQLHSSEVTAKALLNLIQTAHPSDSGTFISFDGTEIDW